MLHKSTYLQIVKATALQTIRERHSLQQTCFISLTTTNSLGAHMRDESLDENPIILVVRRISSQSYNKTNLQFIISVRPYCKKISFHFLPMADIFIKFFISIAPENEYQKMYNPFQIFKFSPPIIKCSKEWTGEKRKKRRNNYEILQFNIIFPCLKRFYNKKKGLLLLVKLIFCLWKPFHIRIHFFPLKKYEMWSA